MSSKQSLHESTSMTLHDARWALRGLAPVALVFLILLILCTSVSTAAIPDISVFSTSYTHDQLKFRFWADGMTYPVVLGCVVFGAVCAHTAFKFLLIPSTTTMYFALPLSRRRLFSVRVACSLIVMVLVVLVALGSSLIVNLLALGYTSGEALQFVYVIAGLIICAFVGFALMLVGIVLAGTRVEAVLFGGVLLLAVTVLCWSVNVLMQWLLVGNTVGECLIATSTPVQDSLLLQLSTCNPVLFFVAAAALHQSFSVVPPTYEPSMPDAGLLAAWLVFAVVLLAVDGFLFERRRGEQAGITGLCMPMIFVFSFITGLLVFAAILQALGSTSIAAGLVVGTAAFATISFLLLRGPLRGATSLSRSLCVLVCEVAFVLVSAAIAGTGAFGWADAVPQASDVARVEISYTGTPALFAGEFESASTGTGNTYTSGTYTFDEPDAIDLATNVHNQLIVVGSKELGTDDEQFGESIVAYDMKIDYTLTDGSTMSRYYDRATLDTLASLLSLDDTDMLAALRAGLTGTDTDLSEKQRDLISVSNAAQAFAAGTLYLADAYYTDPVSVNMTQDARDDLLKALAKDLRAQKSADRYYPARSCRGVLMFTLNGSSDADSFSFQIGNTVLYLTDSFSNTLAWMKEKKLAGTIKSNVSTLGEISIVKYDPFASTVANIGFETPTGQFFTSYISTNADDFISKPDYGATLVIDDSDKIRKLGKIARNCYYLNGGGYLVCARIKGTANYVYLFIPANDAPKWLVRQAG